MKNKKYFSLILSVIFLMVILSGCSKPSNEYINMKGPSKSGEAVKTSDINATKNQTNVVQKVDDQTKNILFYTDDVKKDGYIVAIAQAAMEKVGYKVSVEYMPWARASQEVITDGTHDAIIGPSYTEERASKIIYTDPVTIYHTNLLVLKGKEVKYSKFEDLKPYNIGLIKDISITPEFDGASYLKKEIGDTPETNIKKLLAGRVDLIVDNVEAFNGMMKTEFPNDVGKIVPIEPALLEKKIFCGFSKKFPSSDQRTKDFNAGLKMINDDGTVKKFMEQYAHP